MQYQNMTRIVFPILILGMLFTSCKSENTVTNIEQEKLEIVQKSRLDFTNENAEYRIYPVNVKFNSQYPLQAGRIFIKQSGLPDENNILEFKQNKSVKVAYELYRSHIDKNRQSPHLNSFKQYGAWLILTRLDLLASTSKENLELTYNLLSELSATDYEGFQLMAYGINHLYQNGFPAEKIRPIGLSVIDLASKMTYDKGVTVTQDMNYPDRKLDPKIMESLEKYVAKRETNKNLAVAQIKQLLSRI